MISYEQALDLFKRLEYYESLESRLVLIDSLSKELKIDLLDATKIDSIINELSGKNQELIDLETNLRKKISAKDLEITFLDNRLTIEKNAHEKTTSLLHKKNKEVQDLNLKLKQIKRRNTRTHLIIGGTSLAIIGGLITFLLVK